MVALDIKKDLDEPGFSPIERKSSYSLLDKQLKWVIPNYMDKG